MRSFASLVYVAARYFSSRWTVHSSVLYTFVYYLSKHEAFMEGMAPVIRMAVNIWPKLDLQPFELRNLGVKDGHIRLPLSCVCAR